jgi:hypothetical protein
MDDGIFQVMAKFDRSVVINTFQSSKALLDFGGYFLTLLFIADSHFTFHNFFILYAMHVLDSGGILFFCICIPPVLTLYILI